MLETRTLARLAENVFVGAVAAQLALVLLAAPAATAGAICLDRSRGTLSHMLMTDLSNAEIVLGKLAARLVPVISLLVCTLPMMVILTLLGGVHAGALVRGLVVCSSVAVLGCSLAMCLSLWSGKTHEALLATYAVWGLWLLAWPVMRMCAIYTGWAWIIPSRKFDPIYLALAPYWWPADAGVDRIRAFAGAMAAMSALLIALTVLRVRARCTRERAEESQASADDRQSRKRLATLAPEPALADTVA